ncbi:BTB/POZ domain-containing protein 6-B-like [Sitodiplosis mosellana]|uniref:BTB/POZ domain-containing protein 6-B-like n=1 Tax=Sitodiplosis mosellana TaxID=263140 RepID=UPI0024440CDF|nr:BTB/POZ domain-containing protein 6-B-like [Sitodiplosis mosellana]
MEIILKNKATEKLYLNEKLADVHFAFNVGDEIHKVPANKANLAALSPVFDRMFYGSLTEDGDVKIVDASVEAFKEFLQIFYLGEVTLTIENIETVARLADKYDVLAYLNDCATFTQNELTIDNMFWGLQLALFLKNQTLTDYCERKINESPKEVFASDAFRRCDKETLEHILKLNLSCESIDVFNACMDWARYACKLDGLDEKQAINLRNQLGDHLKLIRYDEMSLEEFTGIHVANKGLFNSEEFEDIMLTLTMDKYKSKIFNLNPRQYIWSNDNELQCTRVLQSMVDHKIGEVEVLSFTSNQPVLLGNIQCSLTKGGLFLHGSYVEVDIAQVEDETFRISKLLHNGGFRANQEDDNQMALEKPIFIKPHTMYEIRTTLSVSQNSWCDKLWLPRVELDKGLKITFHRNPYLNYNNSIYGWISSLELNRI